MDRPLSNDAGRRRSLDRRQNGRSGRDRSRSPHNDRYQSGGRSREDYHDGNRDGRNRDDRRRPPTPPMIDRYVPGQVPQAIARVNPMPDPVSLDFQVGFNWFAEWWRVEQAIKEDKERDKDGRRTSNRGMRSEQEIREDREKERSQIQAAYDAYKEQLQVKMARMFVQIHKDEEWFKERYVPEIRDAFSRRLTDFRRSALTQWESDIADGIFDEFNLEGIYKTESNGMGGIVEREEGETVAAAEVLGVADLVPSRGGDLRDDAILQPALLIKTLAPMVSRVQIEDLCKEHLGEQDGGYRWLSLSDPNPVKKCHRIGWIMLHPSAEEPKLDRADGRDEEEGEDGMEVEGKSPSGICEKALQAINGKVIEDEARGNFTCHVGVHVPQKDPRKKALWDLFSAPERISRDLELAKRLVDKFDQDFGSDASGVSKIVMRVEEIRARGGLRQATESDNTKKDKTEADEMDEDGGEEGEEDEDGAIRDEDEIDDEDLLAQKKTLDLLVEYLRRVYNFCFFCVFGSDSVHELTRKCPGGHLRRPRASLSTAAKAVAKASAEGEPYPTKRKDNANEEEDEAPSSPVAEKSNSKPTSKLDQQLQRAFNWVKTYEEKILQILEPENADLIKLGGKPIHEALDEELKKFMKQEDENKYRCKVPECTKLFKGEAFWRKHVEKRHAPWLEEIRQNLALVNAYVLDPAHIAPSRSDANSNGHFPMNNGQPGGTPRGFNLHGMPGMQGGFPGAFNPGYQNAPFATFGNHTVQAPMNGWPMMQNGDEAHMGGPMRRGGGRFNNMRQAGPYDRRQQPRFNGGPMMPGSMNPMGGRRGGGNFGGVGAGKWGDGAGAQAVGPREAVQGRTLKKYDDLDAVETAGGGELNY